MSRQPADPPEISTTSAAILGLLATRSGSAYELARRMKTKHHFIWPRAESKLYEEVKRLSGLKLVAARRERTGERPRTVYRILPAGKRALNAWTRRPCEAPSLSFEALVKLVYADFGTVEDARAHVAATRALAEQCCALGRSLAAEFLAGNADFQERMHANVIAWRFLAGYFAGMLEWSHAIDDALKEWDGTASSKKNVAVARTLFEDGLRVLDRGQKRRRRKSESARKGLGGEH